jgi:thioredoxin reductase (NADPH)
MTDSSIRDFDVVVVGGGVAGLGAAIAAAEEGWQTCVAVGIAPGGRMGNFARPVSLPFADQGVFGSAAAGLALERALDVGVTPIFEQAEFAADGPPWLLTCGDDRLSARAVVIATGRRDPLLGVPGEAELVGRGLSYCASCDGPLFAGEPVVVVGDSDWAVEEVLELAEVVATVSLVAERPELRCTPGRAAKLAETSNVALLTGAHLTGFTEGAGGLEAVTVELAGGPRQVSARGVFALTDGVPDTAGLPDGVAVADGGAISVDEDFATTVAGVFAVGDVTRNRAASLARNSGDGAAAGLAVSRYLSRVPEAAGVAGDG